MSNLLEDVLMVVAAVGAVVLYATFALVCTLGPAAILAYALIRIFG